ncbi:YqeG family HAD IIIA-type phosphatase [Candidatus Woesearchaeota archaeon]|nr:YqeG family HAD IIIA-type phosphatase [Candidatus Woesearchaeota archaeon]
MQTKPSLSQAAIRELTGQKRLYLPDEICRSVQDIDIERLAANGYKAIIFDVDATLIPHHIPQVTSEVYGHLRRAEERGFKICALSNATDPERVKSLEDALGMKVMVARPKKPNTQGFMQAIDYMSVPTNQIVMVGDRVSTDILGGNQWEMYTILVDPIPSEAEPWPLTAIRLQERYTHLTERPLKPEEF